MATTSDTVTPQGPDSGQASSAAGASAGGPPPLDPLGPLDPLAPLDPVGRGYEPMSVRGPALIVLGLAVFLLLGGVVSAAISSESNPTFSTRKVVLADGVTIHLAPATTKFHGIISNGEPPADIIGNLGIPKESVVGGVRNSDQHAAQFDRTVTLHSQFAQGQIIEAYTRMMRAAGWQVIYSGPAPQGTPGSTEVLAKHGSSDGFYWETGVVASPTTPAGTTPYSVEVFETPDGN